MENERPRPRSSRLYGRTRPIESLVALHRIIKLFHGRLSRRSDVWPALRPHIRPKRSSSSHVLHIFFFRGGLRDETRCRAPYGRGQRRKGHLGNRFVASAPRQRGVLMPLLLPARPVSWAGAGPALIRKNILGTPRPTCQEVFGQLVI